MAKFGGEVSLEEARAICDHPDGVVWDEGGLTHGKHHYCDVDDQNAKYLCAEWGPYRCLHDPREQGVVLAPLRELAREWVAVAAKVAISDHGVVSRQAYEQCAQALRAALDSLPAAKPAPKTIEPEPGEPIGTTSCAACGTTLLVAHGDEPGGITTESEDGGMAPKTLEPGDVFYAEGDPFSRTQAELDGDGHVSLVREVLVAGAWIEFGRWSFRGPLTTEPPKPKRVPKPATLADCPRDGTVFWRRLSPGERFKFSVIGTLMVPYSTGDDSRWINACASVDLLDADDWETADGPVNGWEDDDGR